MGVPTILPPFARTWRKRFFLVDPRWRWGPFLLRLLTFFALQKVSGLRKKQGMFDVGGFLDVLCLFGGWGDEGSYKFGSGMFGSWESGSFGICWSKKKVFSKVGTVSVMSEAWIPVCMRRFCTSQVGRIMAKRPSVRRRHKEGWSDIGMNNEGQVSVERLKVFWMFRKITFVKSVHIMLSCFV